MPDILYITAGQESDSLPTHLSKIKLGKVHAISPDELEALKLTPTLIVIKKTALNKGLFQRIQNLFGSTPMIVVVTDGKSRVPAYLSSKENVEIIYSTVPEEICSAVSRLLILRDVLREYRRLKEERDELSKLINIQRNITSMMMEHNDIGELFQEMMKTLKEAFDIRNWIVFLKDNETDEFFVLCSSLKRKQIKELRLSPGEGIVGWVSEKQRPLIVEDIKGDVRARAEGVVHKVMKTRSALVFPVTGKGGTTAVVELINKRRGTFDKEDLLLLSKISEHISMAVEKMMLQLKLEELVITDDLTKLFNLRYLNRTLDIELERANRYHTHVSLIFMDVDHFKDVNDTYGHLVGSKLLTEIAQLLLSRLRSVDIVARYGGDEFVIVLPQTSSKYAAMIAERLRKAVEETVFLRKEGYNIRVTASFGVACYPDTAKSKEELLNLADEAMYKVKYKNRNGVYVII